MDTSRVIVKFCPICGKQFASYKSDRQFTCSIKCGGIFRQKKDLVDCPVCGNPFICYPKYPKKYCSKKCYSIAKKRTTEVKKETRKCLSCDTFFSVMPYSTKLYCSRRCVHLGERGSDSSHWQGGKKLHKGYILIYCPDHPYGVRTGVAKYVREHRLVMERHIGRYLRPEEVVHHINGNKTDNHIENLKLFANHSEHMKAVRHNYQ